MLKIRNLNARVKDSDYNILNDFCLDIKEGEIHAIMGPNGTGKSTLSKVIMGNYMYTIDSGSIVFNSVEINDLEVNERAKMGIFLSMQDPTVIEGVSNSEFLRTAIGEVTGKKTNLFTFIKELEESMDSVGLDSKMIHRSVNSGFSGGEKKKNEILQMLMLKPKLIILDELDSGLDVDSLKIVCQNINKYLKSNPEVSVLMITHYPRILEYIKPDYVHVMIDGKIQKTGDINLAIDVDKNGYNGINAMIGNDVNE